VVNCGGREAPRLEGAWPFGCGLHTPRPQQDIPIRASPGMTCPDLKEIGSGGGGVLPQWFSQPPYHFLELFALEGIICLAQLGRLLWPPAFGLERDLEHIQQRLPQVLKPQTDYATLPYVEDTERPPIFLIQGSPSRSWSYRQQGLHGPEMGARSWGKRY